VTAPRLLLVEDDERLAELVRDALVRAGWNVTHCARGDDGEALMRREAFDIVLLDGHLPGKDGFDVLREVRRDFAGRIVMLTARDDDIDQVLGLEGGADDYIAKPFSLEELLARLQAVLRRTGRLDERGAVLQVSDLTLDELTREVHRAGELVDLTPTEFDLLRFLMQNARTVVSKSQILDRVWHYDFAGRSNIVEQYIGYLRKKVDSDHEPLIHTVRGVGYVLRAPRSGD